MTRVTALEMLPVDGEKVLQTVTADLVQMLKEPHHGRTLDEIVDALVKKDSCTPEDVYYSLSRLDVYQDSDGNMRI